MTIQKYKERVISDFESPAWALLEKVVAEFNKRGIEPDCINLYGGENEGNIWIDVSTVYKHNGANENVSVKIGVYKRNNDYMRSSTRIAKVIVPKDASEKVINKRIDKALAAVEANK